MLQPRQKCILLTLDSFSTLFTPRQPIAAQYLRVANSFGLLVGLDQSDLEVPLKEALKAEARIRPNYGQGDANFGGPKQWWANVIESCFAKAVAVRGDPVRELPHGLVPELLDVFSSNKGYKLYEDVIPFFQELRRIRETKGNVVVGVVTNSDDRVPGVLRSLGVKVGNVRATDEPSQHSFERREDKTNEGNVSISNDVDFVITSYDAGHEKPHREIFDLAKHRGITLGSCQSQCEWTLLHVGDDFVKDYTGATQAGWQSYLLARGDEGPWNRSLPGQAPTINSLLEIIHKFFR